MNADPVDIQTQISTLDLLNAHDIDWKRVRRTAYLIHQHFRYDYPGPVRDLKQRLLIVPPETYGDQRLIVHRLDVSAPVVKRTSQDDEFGNNVLELDIPSIERSIDFEAWIVVERSADAGPHILPGSVLTDSRYLDPSALTQPDDALRKIATTLAHGSARTAGNAGETYQRLGTSHVPLRTWHNRYSYNRLRGTCAAIWSLPGLRAYYACALPSLRASGTLYLRPLAR